MTSIHSRWRWNTYFLECGQGEDFPYDQARAKFKKLKSHFIREHKKKIRSAPSGSASKISTKWEFYICLVFLSVSGEKLDFSEASCSGPAHHEMTTHSAPTP
ncbi:uncharacterized protein LOC143030292 isoform X2 [Oratosquilla oratoria]|uniref:uncharacterized protein LOC143030292 isoform X2 n=1 Tax=Oratosquilla oratoria TaxID=337810 RepID=UPI003F75A37B